MKGIFGLTAKVYYVYNRFYFYNKDLFVLHSFPVEHQLLSASKGQAKT